MGNSIEQRDIPTGLRLETEMKLRLANSHALFKSLFFLSASPVAMHIC